MADRPEPGQEVRRRPDLFLLVCGALTLLVSGYVLSDGSTWLPSIDPRWVLAGGALLVGVLLLVSSMSRRSR